jgi:hypothetical protein
MSEFLHVLQLDRPGLGLSSLSFIVLHWLYGWAL